MNIQKFRGKMGKELFAVVKHQVYQRSGSFQMVHVQLNMELVNAKIVNIANVIRKTVIMNNVGIFV